MTVGLRKTPQMVELGPLAEEGAVHLELQPAIALNHHHRCKRSKNKNYEKLACCNGNYVFKTDPVEKQIPHRIQKLRSIFELIRGATVATPVPDESTNTHITTEEGTPDTQSPSSDKTPEDPQNPSDNEITKATTSQPADNEIPRSPSTSTDNEIPRAPSNPADATNVTRNQPHPRATNKTCRTTSKRTTPNPSNNEVPNRSTKCTKSSVTKPTSATTKKQNCTTKSSTECTKTKCASTSSKNECPVTKSPKCVPDKSEQQRIEEALRKYGFSVAPHHLLNRFHSANWVYDPALSLDALKSAQIQRALPDARHNLQHDYTWENYDTGKDSGFPYGQGNFRQIKSEHNRLASGLKYPFDTPELRWAESKAHPYSGLHLSRLKNQLDIPISENFKDKSSVDSVKYRQLQDLNRNQLLRALKYLPRDEVLGHGADIRAGETFKSEDNKSQFRDRNLIQSYLLSPEWLKKNHVTFVTPSSQNLNEFDSNFKFQRPWSSRSDSQNSFPISYRKNSISSRPNSGKSDIYDNEYDQSYLELRDSPQIGGQNSKDSLLETTTAMDLPQDGQYLHGVDFVQRLGNLHQGPRSLLTMLNFGTTKPYPGRKTTTPYWSITNPLWNGGMPPEKVNKNIDELPSYKRIFMNKFGQDKNRHYLREDDSVCKTTARYGKIPDVEYYRTTGSDVVPLCDGTTTQRSSSPRGSGQSKADTELLKIIYNIVKPRVSSPADDEKSRGKELTPCYAFPTPGSLGELSPKYQPNVARNKKTTFPCSCKLGSCSNASVPRNDSEKLSQLENELRDIISDILKRCSSVSPEHINSVSRVSELLASSSVPFIFGAVKQPPLRKHCPMCPARRGTTIAPCPCTQSSIVNKNNTYAESEKLIQFERELLEIIFDILKDRLLVPTGDGTCSPKELTTFSSTTLSSTKKVTLPTNATCESSTTNQTEPTLPCPCRNNTSQQNLTVADSEDLVQFKNEIRQVIISTIRDCFSTHICDQNSTSEEEKLPGLGSVSVKPFYGAVKLPPKHHRKACPTKETEIDFCSDTNKSVALSDSEKLKQFESELRRTIINTIKECLSGHDNDEGYIKKEKELTVPSTSSLVTVLGAVRLPPNHKHYKVDLPKKSRITAPSSRHLCQNMTSDNLRKLRRFENELRLAIIDTIMDFLTPHDGRGEKGIIVPPSFQKVTIYGAVRLPPKHQRCKTCQPRKPKTTPPCPCGRRNQPLNETEQLRQFENDLREVVINTIKECLTERFQDQKCASRQLTTEPIPSAPIFVSTAEKMPPKIVPCTSDSPCDMGTTTPCQSNQSSSFDQNSTTVDPEKLKEFEYELLDIILDIIKKRLSTPGEELTTCSSSTVVDKAEEELPQGEKEPSTQGGLRTTVPCPCRKKAGLNQTHARSNSTETTPGLQKNNETRGQPNKLSTNHQITKPNTQSSSGTMTVPCFYRRKPRVHRLETTSECHQNASSGRHQNVSTGACSCKRKETAVTNAPPSNMVAPLISDCSAIEAAQFPTPMTLVADQLVDEAPVLPRPRTAAFPKRESPPVDEKVTASDTQEREVPHPVPPPHHQHSGSSLPRIHYQPMLNTLPPVMLDTTIDPDERTEAEFSAELDLLNRLNQYYKLQNRGKGFPLSEGVARRQKPGPFGDATPNLLENDDQIRSKGRRSDFKPAEAFANEDNASNFFESDDQIQFMLPRQGIKPTEAFAKGDNGVTVDHLPVDGKTSLSKIHFPGLPTLFAEGF